MRLNRLPHGFCPASLRCLCAMDPESLGKALQDCLRALGTRQGADPPAAPAPQAAAAPPAAHLADEFPLREEVVVHNTCNPDTTLAPETPEWRWLADVTPKYVFCRAMTLWMKKHRQEDKDGVQSYPWEMKCLSAGQFSEWKVLRVGLSSDLQGHMSLEEPGLDALFRIWATAGCSVARSASWFGADSLGRGGGHQRHTRTAHSAHAGQQAPPGPGHRTRTSTEDNKGTGHHGQAHRRTAAKWHRTPHTQSSTPSGHTDEQEPSGQGHPTHNTTHRAGARVNRSQVA